MNINKERLWDHIHSLGKFGRNTEGGMTRLSFTEEEKAAKEIVSQWMEEAGMSVHTDEIGNLIGRYEGKSVDAPVVLVGSHIDTVINGGIFDGAAGVLSAIEAIHTMSEQAIIPYYPIEVIAFTDEEGARFSNGMLGSKALVGKLKKEDLYRMKDMNQVSAADAMKQFGYDPEKLDTVKRSPEKLKNYLELHIEQGKVLEDNNLSVGIVTGIAGPVWFNVRITGESGHAGATPMDMRKDPMVGASIIISKLEEIAGKETQAVATIGKIESHPGGINIIPDCIEFTVDIRDISEETLIRLEKEVRELVEHVANQRDLGFEIDVLHRVSPSVSSPDVMKLLEESCSKADLPTFHLPSGAGHDAMIVSEITDMGMIFVRSKDGISHNPNEWTDKTDLANGTEVLFFSLNELASTSVM
ncbi:Zn-dependent hydrolase [Virgibacillus siamensis]|uniref:Zn-dependent hydrolase n=1 Tax=Virgibacillus siamensis TaxID=480071 RepID=UPI00098424A1|nr:Zn-dependent hydrolase [Virgibacillus siamensis]